MFRGSYQFDVINIGLEFSKLLLRSLFGRQIEEYELSRDILVVVCNFRLDLATNRTRFHPRIDR